MNLHVSLFAFLFLAFNLTGQEIRPLDEEIIAETRRSWEAYKTYAWGHDVLTPLSKSYLDWYDEPLYISPIDAYSTLFLMGLDKEAALIERYVIDSLDFDKDLDVKVFEVNIRILGGLVCMYELSRNPAILEKARDFADRMLPAFDTPTGIPKYWVNLRTGKTHGDTINVAEAGTYLIEMGVLSYYTQDPKYYQAARNATLAIFNRRSDLGLIGSEIEVQTGEWVSPVSHLCAGVDSYYEYLYKAYLLFGDDRMKRVWDESIARIHQYLSDWHDNNLWYCRVDMHSGEIVNSIITLYDAFFPALLALSGDTSHAIALQDTWLRIWDMHGIEPTAYDYKHDTLYHPGYYLNPEIMESAYYLFHITGDSTYYRMNARFWEDIKAHCRTEVAFTSIADVRTKKQEDYMPTFFFAETLKYLYLTFSKDLGDYAFEDIIFNTEAHPFRRDHFDYGNARLWLGLE